MEKPQKRKQLRHKNKKPYKQKSQRVKNIKQKLYETLVLNNYPLNLDGSLYYCEGKRLYPDGKIVQTPLTEKEERFIGFKTILGGHLNTLDDDLFQFLKVSDDHELFAGEDLKKIDMRFIKPDIYYYMWNNRKNYVVSCLMNYILINESGYEYAVNLLQQKLLDESKKANDAIRRQSELSESSG
jgi:hypothetical protein